MIFNEAIIDRRTRHILVVDPDSVRRGMLAITLPKGEYRLDFGGTEEQGLSLLKEHNHEIVIVGKSEMSKNLCQHIRALAYSCMLILMDEAFIDEVTGEAECNEAGADTHLPFPFEAALFEQRVEGCYARRQAPRSPRETSPSLVDDAVAAVAQAPAVDSGATWEEFSKRIAEIHNELNFMDYYQLLEVNDNAPGNEIKNAYFESAMRYHPDRFMQLRNKQLKGQIYEVYKRLSEAFKVLINPVTRKYYDKQLEAAYSQDYPEPNLRFLNFGRRARRQTEALTREAQTEEGKRFLHYAKLAEAEGRYLSARDYMIQALELEPENEDLKEHLKDLSSKTDLDLDTSQV